MSTTWTSYPYIPLAFQISARALAVIARVGLRVPILDRVFCGSSFFGSGTETPTIIMVGRTMRFVGTAGVIVGAWMFVVWTQGIVPLVVMSTTMILAFVFVPWGPLLLVLITAFHIALWIMLHSLGYFGSKNAFSGSNTNVYSGSNTNVYSGSNTNVYSGCNTNIFSGGNMNIFSGGPSWYAFGVAGIFSSVAFCIGMVRVTMLPLQSPYHLGCIRSAVLVLFTASALTAAYCTAPFTYGIPPFVACVLTLLVSFYTRQPYALFVTPSAVFVSLGVMLQLLQNAGQTLDLVNTTVAQCWGFASLVGSVAHLAASELSRTIWFTDHQRTLMSPDSFARFQLSVHEFTDMVLFVALILSYVPVEVTYGFYSLPVVFIVLIRTLRSVNAIYWLFGSPILVFLSILLILSRGGFKSAAVWQLGVATIGAVSLTTTIYTVARKRYTLDWFFTADRLSISCDTEHSISGASAPTPNVSESLPHVADISGVSTVTVPGPNPGASGSNLDASGSNVDIIVTQTPNALCPPHLLDFVALNVLIWYLMIGALLISHACDSSCDSDTSVRQPFMPGLALALSLGVFTYAFVVKHEYQVQTQSLVDVLTPGVAVVASVSPNFQTTRSMNGKVEKSRYLAMTLVAISIVDAWATQENGSMSVLLVLASLTLLAEILIHILLLGICHCWKPNVGATRDHGSHVSDASIATTPSILQSVLPTTPAPMIRDTVSSILGTSPSSVPPYVTHHSTSNANQLTTSQDPGNDSISIRVVPSNPTSEIVRASASVATITFHSLPNDALLVNRAPIVFDDPLLHPLMFAPHTTVNE
jgi:hypothetical protein